MVYILDELVLDYFDRGDCFLDMKIRGSIDEVNKTMRKIYGSYECVEKIMNFQEFSFEGVNVKYWRNGYLSVKVLSSDKRNLDKLEFLIGEI